MTPQGVSQAEITCPACGAVLQVALLIEARIGKLGISGDWDVVMDHIRELHPEAVE